jgi:hypothetical protein
VAYDCNLAKVRKGQVWWLYCSELMCIRLGSGSQALVLNLPYIERQFCRRPVWLNALGYSKIPYSLQIAVQFDDMTTARKHITRKLRRYLSILSNIAAYNLLTHILDY